MNLLLPNGARHGTVSAPPSKSVLHRLLLCAALGAGETTIRCGALPDDARATAACLRALGTAIDDAAGALRVTPIRRVPEGECVLPCGESGSTLRFLLPVVGALGASAVFRREGRLPQRPLRDLTDELARHGMRFREDGNDLYCEGKLLAGFFAVTGAVSSQFVTGLLFALPLLAGESTLKVTSAPVSAPYVALTERALREAGVRFDKSENCYTISGGQRFAPPPELTAEGDWSAAAPFLCMGALSREGVRVCALDLESPQGDRAALDILRRFGARVQTGKNAAFVRRGTLHGVSIDAGDVPDLVPALAALASVAEGETRITGAARLRDKESDRLEAAASLLNGLGADVRITADGLLIRGKGALSGGTADARGDHRIAMAAAVAACACTTPVRLRGADCVSKSYPAFWEDLECLSM